MPAARRSVPTATGGRFTTRWAACQRVGGRRTAGKADIFLYSQDLPPASRTAAAHAHAPPVVADRPGRARASIRGPSATAVASERRVSCARTPSHAA